MHGPIFVLRCKNKGGRRFPNDNKLRKLDKWSLNEKIFVRAHYQLFFISIFIGSLTHFFQNFLKIELKKVVKNNHNIPSVRIGDFFFVFTQDRFFYLQSFSLKTND